MRMHLLRQTLTLEAGRLRGATRGWVWRQCLSQVYYHIPGVIGREKVRRGWLVPVRLRSLDCTGWVWLTAQEKRSTLATPVVECDACTPYVKRTEAQAVARDFGEQPSNVKRVDSAVGLGRIADVRLERAGAAARA